MKDWSKAKIVKIEDISNDVAIFHVEILDTDNFIFTPGQFVTFDLPIHEKKNKRLKSYSIASAPNGKNIIELIITRVPEGLGTTFLFDRNKCNVGTVLDYRGPVGVFTLKENLQHPLFLICTGTGIAPFRSMLHHIYNQQIAHHNIYLIFGTRTQKDIFYFEEMKELQSKMKNFYYEPVLSRENWDGHKGYVHEVYKKILANNMDAQFMLCGWRPMIDEARKTLNELGIEKSKIHFELYG